MRRQIQWKRVWAVGLLVLGGCGGDVGGGGGDETPDTQAPSTPGVIRADPISSWMLGVAWTASSDNVGVTGYRVERCTGEGCTDFAVVGTQTELAHQDPNLEARTLYRYRVAAFDAAGNVSAASAVAEATTPEAPIDGGAGDGGTGDAGIGDGGTSNNANATVAGEVRLPYPTLHHLTVEWGFSGDANANGVVTVRYRASGTSAWRASLPLRRVPGESNEGFTWSTRHSGSVFDLQPGTTYELELSLTDPDGGTTTRTVSATTRAVPAPMAGAPVKAVTPGTFATVAASAQPGDILALGAGTYSGFDFARSGEAGRPIVIRGTAGTVINGQINLFSRSHVHLDGLTVNGRIRFNGSNHIAITRCTLNASNSFGGDGIVTYLRAENAYIADNVVTGLTAWAEASLGVNGNNLGEGILVTGPGHVILHNRVNGFRDGISLLEDDEAVDQFSIDILNNDLGGNGDDGIEADFCFHNCRIVRNRLTNNFIALSSQPGLGGPTWFIRNAVYNPVHLAFKLYRGSAGDVLLHNTVVKNGDALGIYAGRPVSRLYSRNNLFIGGPGGSFNGYSSGSGRVLHLPDLVTAGSSMDFDGFGSTTGTFTGSWGSTRFTDLASLRGNTSEKNAVLVGLGVFAATVAYPAAPMTLYASPDLRLRAGSAAENVGQVLPGVTDGFSGGAPDLGAHEVGAALPVYGPRP
ncbi:right-handed parallel beta-helix repeat-containing protein [Pyxidicoccus xibeiensis]|uniref:right-handed parallel beta-helix repeat-containing protein n=1 Tax=Pyxidicoccus xibeiensis TaxID=2906759 RepID=UPI0020A82980|nr:right-handed parallel beta-helix repeat-containing protein [Pyxidicoccus xibeiensis]MCP3138185.1 right-handed parallel beta-helix repeat-containing protein [Pyxidicoccus xibeiensis]